MFFKTLIAIIVFIVSMPKDYTLRSWNSCFFTVNECPTIYKESTIFKIRPLPTRPTVYIFLSAHSCSPRSWTVQTLLYCTTDMKCVYFFLMSCSVGRDSWGLVVVHGGGENRFVWSRDITINLFKQKHLPPSPPPHPPATSRSGGLDG